MNRATNFFCIAICCYSAIAFAADNSQFEVGKQIDPKYVSILTCLQKQPEKGTLVEYESLSSTSGNEAFLVGDLCEISEGWHKSLLRGILKDGGMLIVLINPQFEAEKHEIGRGGIIKDVPVHQKVIDKVVRGIVSHGFMSMGVIESPILGSQGNKEFIGFFKRTENVK